MSIETALNCFKENVTLINPRLEPAAWNLNNGLLHLSRALRQDLVQMKRELKQLQMEVSYLHSQKG